MEQPLLKPQAKPPLVDADHALTGAPLTAKESREIVTPYAFRVCPELHGVPLASPARRAVAMTIDAILISGLAAASLVVILPVMVYLIWLRLKLQKYGQVTLLIMLTFIMATSGQWTPDFNQDQSKSRAGNEVPLGIASSAMVAATALRISAEDCEQQCVDSTLEQLKAELLKQGVNKSEASSLFSGLLASTDLSRAEQSKLHKRLSKGFLQATAQPKASSQPVEYASEWYLPDADTHSILAWAKGIIEELGFGFGWAVAYFTLFVGWAHGQTIGKKMLGIKVIQLDGTDLTLAAAFSRQGGYGAGLATGLMGFLQVYWDPNRQAIQDKVAATVVIRLGQPKQPLTH